MKSLENSIIQIGAWRVDPALDEISRGGQTTKLEPKMMQLLLCLAAHAGQVVSVEQLLDQVWKNVVVTPDSVYHAVAALRRVLGDDSKDPSYIANVMRRGYRLIAPVIRLGEAEPPASPEEPPHSAAGNQAVKATVEVPWSQSIRELTGHQIAIATITVLAMALAYFVADRFWISKRSRVTEASAPIAQTASATPATAAVFTPPPHSIAVLPFVNISGDKEQDYFSDGLTEELLNSLSRINELQVAARTSSFYFKGEHADLSTIAHKLNVASVLEGSVRRSGHKIRVTAQLTNAITGFHLWSQTYDRELSDVLQLETEIANAVANALKVTLLSDVAAKIEVGGTRNPLAFDAYLHALNAYYSAWDAKALQAAVDGFTEAIRLDDTYALAYADRSLALRYFAATWAEGPAVRASFVLAEADARKAITLASNLAEGHLALASLFESSLEFTLAAEEYERALALEPGNARLLGAYSQFAVKMGHTEPGLAAAHRAVVLDPLNPWNHAALGYALGFARRYQEGIAALTNAKALTTSDALTEMANGMIGITYYVAGDFQSARVACESANEDMKSYCLAMTYDKLGRHTDSEAALARLHALQGEASPVDYARVYAQWGDSARALGWLEAAMRRRDPKLEDIKVSKLLDPLRNEPRFQAIERELKFPL
jgi:TolB-like protein/DNA-binding winged helix-turn-helix (wHTH) protein